MTGRTGRKNGGMMRGKDTYDPHVWQKTRVTIVPLSNLYSYVDMFPPVTAMEELGTMKPTMDLREIISTSRIVV
jgi:hypothetical protein